MSRESLWAGARPEDASHDWFAAPPRRPVRPQEPPPEPPRKRWWQRPAWVGGLAGLVVLLTAGTVLMLGGGDGEDPGAIDPLPASRGGVAASDIGKVYARVEKSVVSVQVAEGVSGVSSGTGFVINRNGKIVTNAHVIGEAKTARVHFDDGGDAVRAEVVGTDPSSDLAVLNIDPDDVDDELRALPLADSDEVQVGDVTIAVGYPLGLDRTATSGIVSGLGREIRAPNGFRIDEVIQTDASINPGNSGGPLLDGRGRVIGVNSQIATAGSRGNIGIGFAVPSNTVREVVPQLEKGRNVRRPFLGVTTQPSLRSTGATIVQISPNSPAERAGLEAGSATGAGGDTITSIDGRPIITPDDVVDAVAAREPGDKVAVVVERNGVTRRLTVTLGVRPSRTP